MKIFKPAQKIRLVIEIDQGGVYRICTDLIGVNIEAVSWNNDKQSVREKLIEFDPNRVKEAFEIVKLSKKFTREDDKDRD